MCKSERRMSSAGSFALSLIVELDSTMRLLSEEEKDRVAYNNHSMGQRERHRKRAMVRGHVRPRG